MSGLTACHVQPGSPAFAPGRVAQHGHDRAVADVLDRRLERRPAGRIGLGRRRNDPAHEPVAPPAVPRDRASSVPDVER